MKEKTKIWGIVEVFYDTYNNILKDGDKPQQVIKTGMTLDEAVEWLFNCEEAYRYAIKPLLNESSC